MEELEEDIKEQTITAKIKDFASLWKSIHSPLFRFRDSLFTNVKVHDPYYLLLDEIGETNLDPIHLLRYFEFETDGDQIVLTGRSDQSYNLAFRLYVEDLEEFRNTMLCKLYAFKNCTIKRSQGGSVHPTEFSESLKEAIQSTLIPGVIVKKNIKDSKNWWVIPKLKQQGIDCYDIEVCQLYPQKCDDFIFFPSLSGILAIASAGVALKCPDNEDFYII